MNEISGALLLLAVLIGSSALAIMVRPLLPERHRSRETLDHVQAVTVMMVTFAAIVLGLLTNSVKVSFDMVGKDLRGLGVALIRTDNCLRDYGSETKPIRAQILAYTKAAIVSTWPGEPAPEGDDYSRKLPSEAGDTNIESMALGAMLETVQRELRRLKPKDEEQARTLAACAADAETLIQRRWQLIEQAHPSISLPFYVVLVFWLAVVFAGFGLAVPRSATAIVMLGLNAVAIASVVFVMLDLDSPFDGPFAITSQPLRDAIVHLSR
jgi:hypothetical protein